MRILLLLYFFGFISFSAKAQEVLPSIGNMDFQSERLEDGWEQVLSFNGKFKMVLPGNVQLKSDTIQTDIGKLNYHVFYYQHYREEEVESDKMEKEPVENLLFMLSIYEYPDNSIHSDSLTLLESYFEATIEGATQGVDGELIYANDIKLNEYPGKIWRINYNNGIGVIRSKAFLVKKRLYLLSVVANKVYSMNTSTDRFFDSFEILE